METTCFFVQGWMRGEDFFSAAALTVAISAVVAVGGQ